MTRFPHSELLLALAAIWLTFLAHAQADEPLAVLGVTLERPVFFEDAEAAPLDHLPMPSVRPDAAVAPTAPPPTVTAAARPVDRSPQRILIVGDSMVERLMQRFAAYCHDNGHELSPAIWYASTTIGWARDGKLAQLLTEIDPTYVVVVLGSSELTMRQVERVTPAIRRILGLLGDRDFVWIGPPNWRQDTGINEVLRREVGGARFFRSADLTFERASDGIHPSWDSAAAWMDAIATWIVDESAAPIVLDRPTSEVPRPSARVLPPPRRER
jgi:hypothetical protein